MNAHTCNAYPFVAVSHTCTNTIHHSATNNWVSYCW